ncbi:hypothetical protein D3C86_1757740 [compost metagenome]
MNLPIAASNSVLGILPLSDSLVAFTITMTRIVVLLEGIVGATRPRSGNRRGGGRRKQDPIRIVEFDGT